MTDADFNYLRQLLRLRSGLSLGDDKAYLVESRLGILCRQRNIDTIATMVNRLRYDRDTGLETAVVEAMTTNETLFFRDRTPFDLFRDVLLPEKIAANAATRKLRIWCAAVSTGQEAYSLAMILDEFAPRLGGWRVDLVGTDISQYVLDRARSGLYTQFEVQRGLPIQMLLKYFEQDGDKWRVSSRLRDKLELRQHNLLEPAPQLGQFDIVFCRNVLIYFDLPTKLQALSHLAQRLAPNGALVLGSAETVIGLDSDVAPDPLQRGLYRARLQVRPSPEAPSVARPLPAMAVAPAARSVAAPARRPATPFARPLQR